MERRRVRLTTGAAAALIGGIVGLVVARRLFVAAHRPLSWALAAVVAAVLLDPAVARLARHIRRVPAAIVVFLVLGTGVVGTAYLVSNAVESAVDEVRDDAVRAAASIEDRSDTLGVRARDFRLRSRVVALLDAVDERVAGGEDVLRTTAGTAPTYFVGAILTIFVMTYGPRIGAGALDLDPDERRRRRVAGLLGPAVDRARMAIIATVGLAVGVGLAAAGVAVALDLPAPAALGFAAGLLTLLPHVGIVLGSLPLLLLTIGLQSGSTAVILLSVVVALQAGDSLIVRRWIAQRTVDVGLLVPWVVVLLGYAVYGIGGAAFGLALAVFGLAVLDQLDQPAGQA